MATTIVQVPFNIMSGSYETFIEDLRNKLAGSNPEKVEGHPVLAKQTGDDKPPPRWIYVELEGKSGANPKVAIRSDNAYIVGFTNKSGGWFQFKNTAKLLPETKMLSYDGSYRALVGDVDKNLPKLKLGKFNTSDAATALWNHTQKAYVDDNLGGDLMALDLKEALATLAVTFCEAARFIPVSDVINHGWENQTGSSVSITTQHLNYIKNWGNISEALLGWNKDRNDDKWFKNLQNSTGISTGQAALGVVKLLLNKPPKPRGVLAWLRYLWGLLVKPKQQPEKNQLKPKLEKNQQPKNSSIVNPL